MQKKKKKKKKKIDDITLQYSIACICGTNQPILIGFPAIVKN